MNFDKEDKGQVDLEQRPLGDLLFTSRLRRCPNSKPGLQGGGPDEMHGRGRVSVGGDVSGRNRSRAEKRCNDQQQSRQRKPPPPPSFAASPVVASEAVFITSAEAPLSPDSW